MCPVGTERWAGVPGTRARAPPCARPAKDETSPVSTGAGTRRVQSVRHGGRDASSQYGRGGARPAHTARARGLARGVQVAARRAARPLWARPLWAHLFVERVPVPARSKGSKGAASAPPARPLPGTDRTRPHPLPGTDRTRCVPWHGQHNGSKGRARAPRAGKGSKGAHRSSDSSAERSAPSCRNAAARRVSGAKGQRREGSAARRASGAKGQRREGPAARRVSSP